MDTITLESIKQELGQLRTHLEDQADAKRQPLEEETRRIAAQVAAIQSRLKAAQKDDLARHFQDAGRSQVPSGKYEGMDSLDLYLIRALVSSSQRNPLNTNPVAINQWAQNLSQAALQIGDKVTPNGLITQAAMDSTTAAAGDELVPTRQASELWMDVNLDTMVAPLFSRVAMPSSPFDIPLQLGDVNWYPGTENVATTSTALTTAKQTLTAYELVSQVPWSLDLDEDSVIAMMPEVRASLIRNAAEIIDDVLLNADTTLTNNINADGATIAKTDAGKGHWLLGFDGLIHLPLIDNTSQGNSHGGAVSDDMFNELRGSKLAKYGVRPAECVYIMDIRTYLKSLTVSNFRTVDKLGAHATLLTGQLGAHEGIPVIVSEQMLLTASDGKVTDGTAGTVGRLLLVNRSQWRVGFRREISIESERDIQKRQNIMVVSFRIAFAERSGTRSSATHTALQYNITGV